MPNLNSDPTSDPKPNTNSGQLCLPAPAKINLFLHVCGRREDGYHNLQTIFQFLDIADQLYFKLRSDKALNLLTPINSIDNNDNLIIKAARLLQQTTNTNHGVDIRIEKQLPMGAGIGGGSSNAATTLVALNKLWNLQLTTVELKQIGVKLGADVPIFIHGHAAWAEGIGEELSNVEIDEPWYLLAIPSCHVSTTEIFSHSELTRDTKMLKMAAFFEQSKKTAFTNDCEALVKTLFPEVDEALRLLSNFGEARMTGTGACVYANFATKEQALQAANQMPNHLQTLVTKGVNFSPLYRAINDMLTPDKSTVD